MPDMIREQIDHPCAWTAASVDGKEDFVIEIDAASLEVFAQSVADVNRRGVVLEDVSLEDFPLPGLTPLIDRLREELDDGRGLVIVRGFPIGRWPAADIEMMYWGLGLHLGIAASQSVMGDRLGHVVDVSDVDANARAYRSQRELSLHHDFGDYHAMLCLSLPHRGGGSRYASSAAVHNIMLAEAPRHLARLYHGYPLYRLGEQAEDELAYTPHRVPVFSVRDGMLSSRFMRGFIEAAATLRDTPLTTEDVAALDCYEAIAHRDDVMIEFTLQPGEAALYNNLVVMHARAAFEDDKSAGVRRHLLRLWLYADNARPVVPEIEVFDSPGIPAQPGRSPSGEGELLRTLGAKAFSRNELGR